MEELSLDNILTSSELENLFADNSQEEENTSEEENKETQDTTTEIDVNNLFSQSESVGSEEHIKDEEDAASADGTSSPKFFSSIAKAFAEEGIFPDLNDEEIKKVTTPQDFRDLIEKKISEELDERQRRVDAALNAGMQPDAIRSFESTLQQLDNITDSALSEESDRGEALRKGIMMQDLINKGYTRERAEKTVAKSFRNGDDVEDARDALQECKTFYRTQYKNFSDQAKKLAEQQRSAVNEQSAKLKDSILNDKKFFGELDVDKKTRQKIYDNIVKPVYKDDKSGAIFTALQKYEKENKIDFLKNVSLIFTLTDGFKNLDSLVKGKVKKEVTKGFKELESTLNNTARNSDGTLRFVTSESDDPESFLNGWSLNI